MTPCQYHKHDIRTIAIAEPTWGGYGSYPNANSPTGFVHGHMEKVCVTCNPDYLKWVKG